MKGVKIIDEGKKVITHHGKVHKECITHRDVAIGLLEAFGAYKMPYTFNYVRSVEELDMEVNHYMFLRKYNLV